MTDDNVRRLLFYSKSERERSRMGEGLHPKEPRHFVILPKMDENSKLFEFTETMLTLLRCFLWLVAELANVWDSQVELAGSVVGGGSEVDEVLESPSHSLC
jgi:hypothetical protein